MTVSAPQIRKSLLTFASILILLEASLAPRVTARAQASPQHQVTWDAHSLLIDGQRVLLFSGEFHYWRLPAPGLWLDRLEKMKAAGLNAVSIYFDWQYHSNAPGQYDFTGIRNVDYLLSLTDRLGLYVIARVGPYMNAEADAGGLPGWLLSKPLLPRSQTWDGSVAKPEYSPMYIQYAKEWYDHLLPILARHQVTNGGSIILMSIENEYSQQTGSEQYMQDLYDFARSDRIQVPIFHNDFSFNGEWSKLVNLYAYDSYPYSFNCCHQWWDEHFHGIDTWEETLRNRLSITTPMFVSELQGGSYDPWGGKGYTAVARTLGADWLTAVDQSALAQGTTILNTYMFTGGTSWGYMSAPGVYTSYDYGAPISESGALRPAYYAAHRLGMFLQAYGPALAGATAAPGLDVAINPQVVVHSRIDPTSGEVFTFLRHGDAGASVQTTLSMKLGGRLLTIPQEPATSITVPGHGAELLVQNVNVGPLHLNYSTSQVLTSLSTSEGTYLVLYGPDGSQGEIDFALPAGLVSIVHNAGVHVAELNGELRVNYRHTSQPRTITIQMGGTVVHILATTTYGASRYWVVNGMLVAGPDLALADGDTLKLYDSRSRGIRVYGSAPGASIMIDGRLTAPPDAVDGVRLLGQTQGAPTIGLPELKSWRFEPEAPEISPAFDDSHWTLADHVTTSNPNVPPGSTLLADDYGFHYGFVWYRGHFTATGTETAISLAARQSYSVYLNGMYLGSADESLADPPHRYAEDRLFTIPAGTIHAGQDNLVSVLTESLGHDEGWIAGPAAQSPQGLIRGALVGSAGPITWRIQGNAGGEQPADPTRGAFNASGLYGERQGWYLPGFDNSAWQTVATPDVWTSRGVTAPVGWYRTRFQLNLPSGTDVPMGLTLPHVSDKATIWLNGWLVGRYWEQEGPQHDFYLPDGILNPHGDNVLAIAVWNRGHEGGLVSSPRLFTYPSLTGHALRVAAPVSPSGPDYWHTSGNRIVDSLGRPVRIAAVNWAGMQGAQYVPAGLDRESLDTIVTRIRDLGFNTIRLPFSNQLAEQNPVVSAGLDANPDLKGLHALDVMDRIVASAGRAGLRVILEDHRSSVGADPEENGLWYTPQYPESAWIHDWQTLAARYKGDPTVVGVDLRNEPHTAPPGPWSVKTYLHQGATWGPYHGIENRATDWRLAAERGGDAVLGVNPHLLVFVEGLQQYPDPSQPYGVDSYWWGGIFQPARKYPVVLSVPHQLVYSPHEYGPLKWNMPFFGPHMSYRTQFAVWEKHWGFLEQPSYPQRAPIFIGEFGTCGQSPRCVNDTAPGSQGFWFQLLMRFLKTHPEVGWSFWAVNGSNPEGSPQANYILRQNWRTVRLPTLIDTLRDVEIPPPPS